MESVLNNQQLHRLNHVSWLGIFLLYNCGPFYLYCLLTTSPSSKYHTTLFKVPHNPLQSTTPPSSKYHTPLFKVPHNPLQSTVSWPGIFLLYNFGPFYLYCLLTFFMYRIYHDFPGLWIPENINGVYTVVSNFYRLVLCHHRLQLPNYYMGHNVTLLVLEVM